MNPSKGNLILILSVIVIAAVLIVIYYKKKSEATVKSVENSPGVNTVSYRLPSDVNPAVFGSKYWEAFHDLTSRIPCGACKDFAVKFMIFFHDLVNLKLGKPLFDPENFAEMSQLVTMVNLKGNKWPE